MPSHVSDGNIGGPLEAIFCFFSRRCLVNYQLGPFSGCSVDAGRLWLPGLARVVRAPPAQMLPALTEPASGIVEYHFTLTSPFRTSTVAICQKAQE